MKITTEEKIEIFNNQKKTYPEIFKRQQRQIAKLRNLLQQKDFIINELEKDSKLYKITLKDKNVKKQLKKYYDWNILILDISSEIMGTKPITQLTAKIAEDEDLYDKIRHFTNTIRAFITDY